MKEIRDILRAYSFAEAEGIKTALATVVHVEGSSYRRPGARMLITESGELTGAISGGCLEGDALRKALMVISLNKSMLVTYDTTDEDDAKFGIGLGCNGIIQVLIEPIDAFDPNNPIELLRKANSDRLASVLVTVFSMSDKKNTQPGTCFLVRNGKNYISKQGQSFTLIEDSHEVLQSGESVVKLFDHEGVAYTAFIEFLAPAISLIIIGAGNDVSPLVQMAKIMGWDITIADGRPAYAKTERFPMADKIFVTKPEKLLEQLSIDERTVFVLMTHNYNYELNVLKELLVLDISYIGLLGPRKKFEKMQEELTSANEKIPAENFQKVHSPVGLDIGAETAEEIAMAVIAEIQAVMKNKNAVFLKDSTHPIHQRNSLPQD